MLNFDIEFFYFINHFRNPVLDTLLPIFSNSLFIDLFYLLVSFLLWFKYSFKKYLVIVFFMILGFLLVDFSCARIFKPIFKRERPFVSISKVYYYSNKEFECLNEPLKKKASFSFPSCHASNSSFLSFFLSFFNKKLAVVLYPFFMIVGWSRVYLGQHYPLDVLGGWVVGLSLAFVFYKFCNLILNKIDAKTSS